MSVRNFRRVFQRETGLTPRRYIEFARLNMVRELLEDSQMPLKRVAAHAGFVNATAMRVAFTRNTGISPSLYRAECLRQRHCSGNAHFHGTMHHFNPGQVLKPISMKEEGGYAP